MLGSMNAHDWLTSNPVAVVPHVEGAVAERFPGNFSCWAVAEICVTVCGFSLENVVLNSLWNNSYLCAALPSRRRTKALISEGRYSDKST